MPADQGTAAGTAATAAVVPVPQQVAENVLHFAKAITNIAPHEYPPFPADDDEEDPIDLLQPANSHACFPCWACVHSPIPCECRWSEQGKCQSCKSKGIVCNIDGTVPSHKRMTRQGEVRPHRRALYDHVYKLRYEAGKGKGEWPIKAKVELKWKDLDEEFPKAGRSDEFKDIVRAAKREERAEALKSRARQVHWIGKVPSYAESVKLTKKLVSKWTKAENKQAHWVWTVTRLRRLYRFDRNPDPRIATLQLPPRGYQPPLHLPCGMAMSSQADVDAAARSDGEEFDNDLMHCAPPNPLLSLPGLGPGETMDGE